MKILMVKGKFKKNILYFLNDGKEIERNKETNIFIVKNKTKNIFNDSFIYIDLVMRENNFHIVRSKSFLLRKCENSKLSFLQEKSFIMVISFSHSQSDNTKSN